MSLRTYTIILAVALSSVSCQNNGDAKSNQKIASDTTKQSDSLVSIKVTPAKISIKEEEAKIPVMLFPEFWRNFRAAVLAFDTAKIIEMTVFPFQTRGESDSDPVIEYTDKEFLKIFKTYLGQWDGADLTGETELTKIKRTESAKETDVQKDHARIGDLEFKKTPEGWKLFFAYLDN